MDYSIYLGISDSVQPIKDRQICDADLKQAQF